MRRGSTVSTIDKLKQRLVNVCVWSAQQSIIAADVAQCRRRLQACVRVKGTEHFEHLFLTPKHIPKEAAEMLMKCLLTNR